MTEQEKVIAALEHCAVGIKPCDRCPMNKECTGTVNAAMVAAARLLKDQKKRIERLIDTLKVILGEKEE